MGAVKWVRPWMYPKQAAAIFSGARIAVVEASTKSGKTAGCLIWLTDMAMILGKPGRSFWWVAPVYGQAAIAYRRMKLGLPTWMYRKNDTDMTLTFRNGAVIWFKSAEKPDNLYGEDVFGVVLDEATRMREEAWWAIRSTVTATRAPVRIIGNVKGRRNWAYKMARRAESGDAGMSYAKITAWDAVEAGVLEADEIEGASMDLPETVFKELYLAEAGEGEGNPFGIKAIQACKVDGLAAGPITSWGWDLAKSVDWTVGIGLTDAGAVAAFERFQQPWPETEDRIALNTGKVQAYVDSTGVGDPILDHLQRPERGVRRTNYEGWKFNAGSKQKLMEGLAVAIQRGRIAYPDGLIVSELEQFEYRYTRTGVTYEAPEGVHDDCVDALALAVARSERAVVRWGAV